MKDDRICLRHVHEAIEDIEQYASAGRDAFMSDKVRQDVPMLKAAIEQLLAEH